MSLCNTFMETKNARNYRVQVWYDAMPDKILLGTVSICAEDPEMALQMTKAHTKYQLIAVENIFWRVQEPAAKYEV
jgi:hypothetical protein